VGVKVRVSVIVAVAIGGNHAGTLYYNVTAVHRRPLHSTLYGSRRRGNGADLGGMQNPRERSDRRLCAVGPRRRRERVERENPEDSGSGAWSTSPE